MINAPLLDMYQMDSEQEEINLGQHVLAEFFECDPNTLNSIDKQLFNPIPIYVDGNGIFYTGDALKKIDFYK